MTAKRSSYAVALSLAADAAFGAFLLFPPETWNIPIQWYAVIRIVLSAWVAYLKFWATEGQQ